MKKLLLVFLLFSATAQAQIVISQPQFVNNVGVVTGPLLFPDGTAAAPAISWSAETSLGIRRRTTNIMSVMVGSSTGFIDLSGVTNSEHINLKATGMFGISSGNADAAVADVGISRTAVGTMAVGNGTNGDVTGTFKAALYFNTGTGLAVANVAANSCGTTTATIVGGANAFVITVGATSGTQCRVAFPVAATTEYDCAANDETTAIAMRVTPVDTTHTDFLGSFVAADKISAVCFAR